MSNILHKFNAWLQEAELFEEDWRKNCNNFFNYYQGDQWTNEEIYDIESRNQQATVLNLVRPTIDTLLSIEVSRRTDTQVVGREASDDQMSDTLTKLLSQIDDISDAKYYESQSFREGVIGGRGWIGCGVKKNEEGQYDIIEEWIPFEEMYIDPFYRKPDGSDARFIIRCVWKDKDVVKEMFPGKFDDEAYTNTFNSVFCDSYEGVENKAQENSSSRFDYYDSDNERIRLCYCWYKDGQDNMHYVVFSDSVFFVGSDAEGAKNPDPLKINTYPIVPFTCFTKKDGTPMGMVSLLIDSQDQLNKLNSKYLWNMSVNRIIMEEGVTDDPEDFRDQWNRPDGLAIINDGKLGSIKIEDNMRESQFLSQQMQFLVQMMQRTSGINDSMFGQGGVNERSAQQQRGRQVAGSSMQTSLLENMHFTTKRVSKVELLLIGQWYTDERVVRVTGSNGLSSYIKLNGSRENEETGETEDVNKIENIVKYDIILKEVAPFDGVREIMLKTFSEIAKAGVLPPQIVGEIMIELSDIPDKQLLMQKLEGFYSSGGGENKIQ